MSEVIYIKTYYKGSTILYYGQKNVKLIITALRGSIAAIMQDQYFYR